MPVNDDFAQLLEVVDKLTIRITQLQTEIKNISATQAIGRGVGSVLQSKLYEVRALEVSLANINKELNTLRAQAPGVSYIPGGAPAGRTPDVNAAFRQARITQQEIAQRTSVIQTGLPGFGATPQKFSTIPTSQNPWVGFEAKILEKKLQDELNSKLSEREKIERQRLQLAKEMLKSEARYKAVLDMAAKQNFTLEDLKAVRTRGTGGIQQVQFEKYNELGIKQNLDIFSNPSGRATAGISNQFRTFGQGVLRDIGELTKWSLALAAVYGPMRKLQELTQEMIENQAKLADATIAVNSSFLDQSKIFDIAADAAQQAGEDVSGVIDAFTLAYRAAGGGADQVERLATAQKLLSDSLILSKLSTLDQSAAIDTLSAAIRQTGGDFSKTTQFLDSWVRVTKVANVDLTTLATGFAVLGDAAETAGIDTDQLNGLLAVVAESSQSSGKEVANAARAIVSGLQSEQGVRALEELGIAAKDTEGNMRNLQDVLVEISSLRERGLISDTQLSRLSLLVGGGTRRQAITATVFENYGRALQVAEESSRASGDAQAALAKQIDTVQTSLVNLGNAFSGLAQTLGQEGGFLNIIQGSVNGVTALVKGFDSLTSVLGKANPAIAAFIAATLILKQQGIPSVQTWVGSLATTTPKALGPGGQQYLPGFGPQLTRGQKLGNFASENILGTGAISGGVQGLLLSALPALTNIFNKEDRFGGLKAGADVVGGITGGIVGSLVAGSPIIGAAVGTAIAEAFVNKTVAYSTNLFGYANAPALGTQNAPLGTPEEREQALRDAEIEIYKSIGGGSEYAGRFLTKGAQDFAQRYVEDINDAIEKRDLGRANRILAGAGTTLEQAGVTKQLVQQAFAQNRPIEFDKERLAYQRASPEAQQLFDAALAAITAAGEGPEGTKTAFTELVNQNKADFGDIVSSIKEISRASLGQQRLAGDIKGAEYARRTTALGGFDTKALQYYTAFGDELVKVNKDIEDSTDAFEAFSTVILTGTAESVPELTAMTGEIQELINLLNDPNTEAAQERLEELGGVKVATDRLKELRETAASVFSDIYNQTRLDQLQIPSIQGDMTKPLQRGEYSLVLQTAKTMQDQFYQGFLDIPDEMYEGLKDSWDAWAQIIEDSGQVFYETVTGIDPQFFQQAMAKLLEEGKLQSQKANPFQIQQLDITSGEGAGLQGSIDYFSRYLAQNFPQYQQNPEDVGVIFSDYVTDVLHGDNLAIKLALQKLVDINQKQLDGMYNIPEGATFWVPLTAAYYRPKNEGTGGINLPEVKGVEDNTQATQLNTQALMNLTDKWNNADPFLYKRPPEPHEDRYEKMNAAYENLENRYEKMNTGAATRLPYEDRYDKMNETPETESFIERLLQGLRNFFYQGNQQYKELGPRPAGGGGFGSVGGRSMENVAPVVNARLDFRVENSTQLMVDGRVLASVITPYLASDLLRLEASQGTITKRYII